MKKIYLLLVIGLLSLLLIGTIYAGVSSIISKPVPIEDKTILDKAGLSDYTKTINYYSNHNIKEVCFYKKDVINTCYPISKFNDIEVAKDVNSKVDNAEDDMLNRVKTWQSEIDNTKLISDSDVINVTITAK